MGAIQDLLNNPSALQRLMEINDSVNRITDRYSPATLQIAQALQTRQDIFGSIVGTLPDQVQLSQIFQIFQPFSIPIASLGNTSEVISQAFRSSLDLAEQFRTQYDIWNNLNSHLQPSDLGIVPFQTFQAFQDCGVLPSLVEEIDHLVKEDASWSAENTVSLRELGKELVDMFFKHNWFPHLADAKDVWLFNQIVEKVGDTGVDSSMIDEEIISYYSEDRINELSRN